MGPTFSLQHCENTSLYEAGLFFVVCFVFAVGKQLNLDPTLSAKSSKRLQKDADIGNHPKEQVHFSDSATY